VRDRTFIYGISAKTVRSRTSAIRVPMLFRAGSGGEVAPQMLNARRHDRSVQPPPLAALEQQVAAVRETMFDVSDVARHVVAQEMTELHVSLQRATNELGRVESLLHDAASHGSVAGAR
jgi:hypothetical protein